MRARLSKTDWVKFGFKELAEHGHRALKANVLSQKLHVSRGSFYWHFKDISDFEDSILEYWRIWSTESLINEFKKTDDAKFKLLNLIERAQHMPEVERAVRAWAIVNPRVAEAVAALDESRCRFIERVLSELNVDGKDIKYRALLLYWSSVGRTVVANKDLQDMNRMEAEKLVTLITS